MLRPKLKNPLNPADVEDDIAHAEFLSGTKSLEQNIITTIWH